MIIEVLVKEIKTVHTDVEKQLDQPLIDVLLEVNLKGKSDKFEIRFTEMLLNLAGKTDKELLEVFTKNIKEYVKTAYKGQQALTEPGGDWEKTELVTGKTFTVEI